MARSGIILLGERELARNLQRLGNIGRSPASSLTKATRPEAVMVRNKARSTAPADTGALKKGIKIKREKRKVGKAVYRIAFYGKAGKGEEFKRTNKSGVVSAFYPISQEYGWTKPDGERVEGLRFYRNAFNNKTQIKLNIIRAFVREFNSIRVRS